MWLLNAKTRRLENFLNNDQVYAILSHTWGEQEVTFDDIHQDLARSMKGYKKIEYTCTQALQDQIKYVWIDTCCIDKSSSVELSEAINSMYRWYYQARKCYAYLSDVHASGRYCFKSYVHSQGDTIEINDSVSRSRWFTRGWTLQELIAPCEVEFYDSAWKLIGRKDEIVQELSDITGISCSVLKDREQLSSASVAQRMGWASKRETARPEDEAYSMLGLFGVNMPLLYGEGSAAFLRLQDAIVNTGGPDTQDHSILVWQNFNGILFAPSTKNFSKAHRVAALPDPRDGAFELVKKGLRLSLLVRPDGESNTVVGGVKDLHTVIAVLLCQYADTPNKRIALRLRRRPLISWPGKICLIDNEADMIFDRVQELASVDYRDLDGFTAVELTIARKPFIWPHMSLRMSLSVTSAYIEGQWPKYMRWDDSTFVPAHQGGSFQPANISRCIGYGNLFMSTLGTRRDVTMSFHTDCGITPPTLLVGCFEGHDVEYAGLGDRTLRPIIAGETFCFDSGFSCKASYVLRDSALIWHLEFDGGSNGSPSENQVKEHHPVRDIQESVSLVTNDSGPTVETKRISAPQLPRFRSKTSRLLRGRTQSDPAPEADQRIRSLFADGKLFDRASLKVEKWLKVVVCRRNSAIELPGGTRGEEAPELQHFSGPTSVMVGHQATPASSRGQ